MLRLRRAAVVCLLLLILLLFRHAVVLPTAPRTAYLVYQGLLS